MSAPKQQFKLGSDHTSVFENDGKSGKYLTASLKGRRYQDDAGDWKSTHSYTATQLAVHIANCQRTLGWMMENAPSDEE